MKLREVLHLFPRVWSHRKWITVLQNCGLAEAANPERLLIGVVHDVFESELIVHYTLLVEAVHCLAELHEDVLELRLDSLWSLQVGFEGISDKARVKIKRLEIPRYSYFVSVSQIWANVEFVCS